MLMHNIYFKFTKTHLKQCIIGLRCETRQNDSTITENNVLPKTTFKIITTTKTPNKMTKNENIKIKPNSKH